MTTFANTLTNATTESAQRNATTTLVVYTEAQLDDVLCRADDYATENDGTLDVWGTHDSGNEWRLRVVKELYDADACRSLLTEAEAARDWDMAQSCKVALGYADGNAEFARARVAKAIYSARSSR